ncbi:MAG: hypothetical protein H6627_06245 [Calditrichae bacterium]|nr:hypothetical protein [Calditrichota bacterium]MCB9058149.1 hypothetical protein [Calditrichia bacterium]
MINLVKNAFLRRFLNFRLKMIARQERAYNFSEELKKVRKILVILPSDQEYSQPIQEFVQKLGAKFSKARVSTFVNSTLRKSDLSWMGLPNEQYLKIIRDESFDLVVDANTEQDQICTYLCALSGAPMRLNVSSGMYDSIYNLHFRSSSAKNINEKLDNVIAYLTFLAKNKQE